MGKLVMRPTELRHRDFERHARVRIRDEDMDGVELRDGPAAEPDSDDEDVPPLREITAETRTLLEAYDEYFTDKDLLGTKLWVMALM